MGGTGPSRGAPSQEWQETELWGEWATYAAEILSCQPSTCACQSPRVSGAAARARARLSRLPLSCAVRPSTSRVTPAAWRSASASPLQRKLCVWGFISWVAREDTSRRHGRHHFPQHPAMPSDSIMAPTWRANQLAGLCLHRGTKETERDRLHAPVCQPALRPLHRSLLLAHSLSLCSPWQRICTRPCRTPDVHNIHFGRLLGRIHLESTHRRPAAVKRRKSGSQPGAGRVVAAAHGHGPPGERTTDHVRPGKPDPKVGGRC